MFVILKSSHHPKQEAPDVLTDSCDSTDCYQFATLSTYKEARQYLFGQLHLSTLDPSENHEPTIITSYCQRLITNKDLSPSAPLGPLKIPDYQIINTEHVWPQSKFSKNFNELDQKNNLHILLPVLSHVNSIRSNHPMGDVQYITSQPCNDAALGKNSQGKTVFEPHPSIKGDVARSLFYFSTRFQLPIEDIEESVIREWHRLDPPDVFEVIRNEEIFALQKDRNPFIDMPYLVDKISNF